MKELDQLIQKLEIENLSVSDKLLITKRIIQLAEEENKGQKSSIYNNLILLVNNQIELEKSLQDTFTSFENSLNKSHNELMKFMKEMKVENQENLDDLKKNLGEIKKSVKLLWQDREKKQYFVQNLASVKQIFLSLAGTITAGGIILAFIKYIVLN